MGSGMPSTQMLVSSSVEIIPASTSQIKGELLFSIQRVGLLVASQSVELSPAPSYSTDIPIPKAGRKSPVVQIPAAAATDDLWCPVLPHST